MSKWTLRAQGLASGISLRVNGHVGNGQTVPAATVTAPYAGCLSESLCTSITTSLRCHKRSHFSDEAVEAQRGSHPAEM